MLAKTDYTELVGLRVRRLRQARGWTQRELVARVPGPRGGQYSSGLVSRVENGYANPPIFVYVHVAEALGLEPEALMGAEDLQRPVNEAELTLLRYLRAVQMEPHEALLRLAPDPARSAPVSGGRPFGR
jgi:transcriptional regulator with XRE-family HTH domain